jgi:hypothetical protein
MGTAAGPVYPDVAHVLAAMRDRGTKIAVVSDIHFDIRPDCVAQGIDRFVDVYVLSYEVAAQKPDPRVTRNGGLIEEPTMARGERHRWPAFAGLRRRQARVS